MLEVHLLGSFHWLWKGYPIAWTASRGIRLLLATLALVPEGRVDRSRLAEMLWPLSFEDQARTNLRKALFQLREALPESGHIFDLDGPVIGVRNPEDWRVDVHEFLKCSTGPGLEARRRALALYRGELLASEDLHHLEIERERLRTVYAQTVSDVLETLIAQKDWSDARDVANQAIRADPLRESHWRYLFLTMGYLRDLPALEASYREAVARFHREVGLSLSQDTVEAYRRARQLAQRGGEDPARPLWQSPFQIPRPQAVEAFLRWLEGEPGVFNLWGPPGTGKSVLMGQYLEICQRRGYAVRRFDGRRTPFRRVAAAARAACAAGQDAPPLVLLVDHLDPRELLDAGFHDQWAPRHHPRVRLAFASRGRLRDFLPLDSPWQRCLTETSEFGWTREEVHRYLEANGLDRPEFVDSALQRVGGSPLGMTLAVELFRHRKRGSEALGWEDQWPRTAVQLSQWMLEEIAHPWARRVAQAMSLVHEVNHELVERFSNVLEVPTDVRDALFGYLQRYSGFVPTETGLGWHDHVRRVLAHDLRWRFPALCQRLQAAAAGYYRELEDRRASEWVWLSQLFLIQEPVLQELLFPANLRSPWSARAGQGPDLEPCLALWCASASAQAHASDSEQAQALRDFLTHPEVDWHTVWCAERLLGFRAALPLKQTTQSLLLNNPEAKRVVAWYLEHQARHEVPSLPDCLVHAYLAAAPAAGPEPTAQLWRQLTTRFRTSRHHLATALLPGWQRGFQAMGFAELPPAAPEDPRRDYFLDLTAGGARGWLQRLLGCQAEPYPG
ncbi:MAG: hypothetical protein K6U87_11895 [Firmicutes bacterium]|nr:hypothetical protein [Bacillota bacterium]